MLRDNRWVQTPIKKTGYPCITHAVPFKAQKDRNYYDYDHRCFVKEHQITELKYDSKHIEIVDGESIPGWWVYDVVTTRICTASAGTHDAKYYEKMSEFAKTRHEQYLCPHEAYIEDSMLRRGQDAD